MKYEIVPATPDDADFIADVVLGAIGSEHTLHMAGSPDRLPLVKELFSRLAARDDSQYSYKNTLVAITPDGERAGAVVSYDGEKLYGLRQAFIDEANRIMGWNLTQKVFTDETSPDEVYLDSLMVTPENRNSGLGSQLIHAAREKAREIGKPLGLLVAFNNPNARKLYDKLGFREAGIRPFAGVDMQHMVLN